MPTPVELNKFEKETNAIMQEELKSCGATDFGVELIELLKQKEEAFKQQFKTASVLKLGRMEDYIQHQVFLARVQLCEEISQEIMVRLATKSLAEAKKQD